MRHISETLKRAKLCELHFNTRKRVFYIDSKNLQNYLKNYLKKYISIFTSFHHSILAALKILKMLNSLNL